MHKDMASEIQVMPSGDRASQQRACSKWRQEFNHVRPHDAIGDKTPAEVYKRSSRIARQQKAVYPSHWLVRKVNLVGQVKIASEHYFVSTSLTGYQVGLQPIDALHWRAYFYEIDLGLVEVAPHELPETLTQRVSKVASVPTCSTASSVRARGKRAPATPRLAHSARVNQKQLHKARTHKSTHSQTSARD